MNSPLVSICIATFNQEDFIENCLNSVLSQKTNFQIEIIVGDDASTDKTQEIIQEFVKKNSGLFKPILRKRNLGCPFNGMDLYHKSRGKYIALLDGDDYWTDPHKLKKQIDYLESNPDCSFCFTDSEVIQHGHKNSILPNFRIQKKLNGIDFADQAGSIAQTCTVVVRANLIKNIPEWVITSYTGDWCMQIHFTQFGFAGYIPETTAIYRIHDQGIWSRLNEFDAWRKNLNFYKNALLQFKDKTYKARLINRVNSTLCDALELANVQANKKEILYWLKIKLTKIPFSLIKQTFHSIRLILTPFKK